ncbi:hypothetical protein QBC41DRAFT_216404 [Cercophora samala]|uniref:Uncharacterized protein n=1 Tax=Cercophora samala TaxID=330535 RepID=A0AA40DFR8_9PEZI|nr:hypothetical protein QBC41DRAFT_216404 [Cercophora samala]
MQLKTILALLPLVATSLGYVVPEGTPDGFYAVTFDDHGNATTHEVDPTTLVTIGDSLEKRGFVQRSAKHLARRQTPGSHGSTGGTFPNHNDYNQCTIGWNNFWAADNFIPARTIFYASSGQAVLAGCNYQRVAFWTPRSVSMTDVFNGFMDANVGYWKTGWAHFNSGQDFTHWRDLQGTAICTNL